MVCVDSPMQFKFQKNFLCVHVWWCVLKCMVPYVGLIEDHLSQLRNRSARDVFFFEELKPLVTIRLAQARHGKKRTLEVALQHGEPEAGYPALYESLLSIVPGFPVVGQRTCPLKMSGLVVVTVGREVL
jgi:hypothetical protein